MPHSRYPLPVVRPRRGPRAAASLWAGCALALSLCGCHTPSLPAFDTASGGWELRRAQGIWQPQTTRPSIAGDLLLAQHPDRRVLLEFSKGGLPVTVLRMTAAAWRLDIPAQGRAYGGSAPPPPRSSWLVLGRDLAGHPPPPGWEFGSPAPGVLRIVHAESGETLEIYLEDPSAVEPKTPSTSRP